MQRIDEVIEEVVGSGRYPQLTPEDYSRIRSENGIEYDDYGYVDLTKLKESDEE